MQFWPGVVCAHLSRSAAGMKFLIGQKKLLVVFFVCVVVHAAEADQVDLGIPKSPVPASGSLPSLEGLEKRGARISALVMDLESGQELAALGDESALVPASVTKLVLAGALLDRFGPEHTFGTRVLVQGTRKGDTLDGNLVVDAGGDPGLTNEHLWRLATDVARLGIKKVTGKLILNTSRFAPIAASDRDTNRLAGASGSAHAYDSPMSAGAVNYSVVGLFVAPGTRAGQLAQLAIEPYPLKSVRIDNRIKTTARGGASRFDVVRVTEGGVDVLRASGTVAMGSLPRTIYRSVSDPDRYAADVIVAFLGAAGVEIAGHEISRDSSVTGQEAIVLQSQPLEWQLRGLLRQSNNFVADTLTLQLDPATDSRTLVAGNAQIQAFINRATVGTKKNGQKLETKLASGSGLTPENRMSARSVVQVLEYIYKNESFFGHVYAALPGAGVEGTLKGRFGDKESNWLVGRLRAKTGTLTSPVVAVGLGGFSRTKAGHWTAFGFIVNGAAGAQGVTVATARAAIEADLERLLRLN
jgi:D-alanyl-D-alanine carboxypeptidase/D-alanyl-D-alanine-endopeptidase (penicillin-binding protein 4)